VLIEQACFGAQAALLAVKTGKRMRVSPPTIAKFMAELTAAGIVEKTTRTGTSSKYRLPGKAKCIATKAHRAAKYAARQPGTQREIVTTCNLLLIVGSLTTTDLIGNGVLALLSHPDQLAKLRAHPELLPHAVEGVLRYDPPAVQTRWVELEPLEIGGMQVQAPEVITVASRGRPRANSPFGGGAHFCLGAPLTRAEAEIAIRLLFEGFARLRLDPRHSVEHKEVPMFDGLRVLWVGA
jgi:cytochrome P450